MLISRRGITVGGLISGRASKRNFTVFCFNNFPKISEHSSKISEDFLIFSEHFPEQFRLFSENLRRLLKVSEYFRAIFKDISII